MLHTTKVVCTSDNLHLLSRSRICILDSSNTEIFCVFTSFAVMAPLQEWPTSPSNMAFKPMPRLSVPTGHTFIIVIFLSRLTGHTPPSRKPRFRSTFSPLPISGTCWWLKTLFPEHCIFTMSAPDKCSIR